MYVNNWRAALIGLFYLVIWLHQRFTIFHCFKDTTNAAIWLHQRFIIFHCFKDTTNEATSEGGGAGHGWRQSGQTRDRLPLLYEDHDVASCVHLEENPFEPHGCLLWSLCSEESNSKLMCLKAIPWVWGGFLGSRRCRFLLTLREGRFPSYLLFIEFVWACDVGL